LLQLQENGRMMAINRFFHDNIVEEYRNFADIASAFRRYSIGVSPISNRSIAEIPVAFRRYLNELLTSSQKTDEAVF
jgi:hypothetical protein